MATQAGQTHFPIVIIGSGFGGLGAAIKLKENGFHDFLILERAADVGGTWRDNSYPGCACDVQSHLYSFSFAPNPDWSHSFSPQPEIWAYLQKCARDYELLPYIRFRHNVEEAAWQEAEKRWRIQTSQGVYTAETLIMAAGALSNPSKPDLPGLSDFQGEQWHSAEWRHDYDLRGKRVAVIGTGASAIQFVPQIQPQVGQLHIFQRTPPWIVPRMDKAFSERRRRLYRRFPLLQAAHRRFIYLTREFFFQTFRRPGSLLARYSRFMALRHLKRSVTDAALREKLTPKYAIGCKRILVSDDYLPALAQPNVELVTDGIREIRSRSIVSNDGAERPLDAIIFGTGFHVTDMPAARYVRGRDGRALREVWGDSLQAFLGTTHMGFPNLFILLGPHTGLGHNSVVYMIEAQIEHVVNALCYMRDNQVAQIEPRPEAQAAFEKEVDEGMRGTVWVTGGCASWYLDKTGRNPTLWPSRTWHFRRRVAPFAAQDYLLTRS